MSMTQEATGPIQEYGPPDVDGKHFAESMTPVLERPRQTPTRDSTAEVSMTSGGKIKNELAQRLATMTPNVETPTNLVKN